MALSTTDKRQKEQKKILSTLFSSTARVAVLRVFMLDPIRAYYQRQLSLVTGLPIRAVQRELERLVSVELLYRRLEGNRAYYQVDMDFVLFPELRSMVLKTASAADRLRGELALVSGVRLAFLSGTGERALVVSSLRRIPEVDGGAIGLELMDSAAFSRALAEDAPSLEPYLKHGADLLGRRDDVIWRRIEAAGYIVPKGAGVP